MGAANGNWIAEKSPAQIRDEDLQAKYGKAYKRYAKFTASELEARMDRPALDQKGKKIKGWRSVYGEEARIEACILRYSRCWPICNWYAVLTLGVLKLTFEEATKQGLRLGNDEGYDTCVLDQNGEPKPLTQAWIGRLLGLRSSNVNDRCRIMQAKKVLHIDGKNLSMVPDPQELTAEERQKVIQTDNFFLENGQNLWPELPANGFKPPRAILELIASIPEKVIRLEYFSKFSAIQTEYENERKVLQMNKEKGWKVLQAEISILIDKDAQASQEETLAAAADFVEIPEELAPLPEPPPPPFPEFPEQNTNGQGTAAAATKDPQPQPARKPEPKPKPRPATKQEPEPEPEPAQEPAPIPVKVEAFVEAVQARFPKNPPTVAQCSEVLAKLRRLKLSTDGFIEHLNPERMEKISHGGALTALMEGYKVTVAAKAKARPPCPFCGCDRIDKLTGNCAGCVLPRDRAMARAIARDKEKERIES